MRVESEPHLFATNFNNRERDTAFCGVDEDLLALVDPSMDRSVANSRIEGGPAVVLVVWAAPPLPPVPTRIGITSGMSAGEKNISVRAPLPPPAPPEQAAAFVWRAPEPPPPPGAAETCAAAVVPEPPPAPR